MQVTGLLLLLAGMMWVVKAGAIITTGVQPPIIYELAQLAVGLALIAAAADLQVAAVPERVTTGVLGVIAVMGWVGVTAGELVGAPLPEGDEFVFPWSLFFLMAALGVFAGLVALGFALRREDAVPLLIAVLPLPLFIFGFLHVELPVLLTGTSWLALGGYILFRE